MGSSWDCEEGRVRNLGFLSWGSSLGPQGLSLGCEVRPACVSGDTSSFTRPRGMLVDAAGWGGRKTTLLVGGPVSQLEPGATRGEPKGKQCPPPPAQRGLFSGHWGPCQGLEGGCSKQSVRLTGDHGLLPAPPWSLVGRPNTDSEQQGLRGAGLAWALVR